MSRVVSLSRRRVLTFFLSSFSLTLLLLLGACCLKGNTAPPPLPEVVVGDVEIVPQVVYTMAETQFRLQARVRDLNGEIITDSTMAVQWTSSSNIFQGTNPANPIVVKVPAWTSNDTSRQADTIQDIVATVNGVPSDQAVVIFAKPAEIAATTARTLSTFCPRNGLSSNVKTVTSQKVDQILLSHCPGDFPAVVMFDGNVDGTFRNDGLFAVAGAAYLEQNLSMDGLEADPSKEAELTIFSSWKSALRKDESELTASNPFGGGTLTSPTYLSPNTEDVLKEDLTNPPSVGLVYVNGVDPATTPKLTVWKDAEWELEIAQAILDQSRAGIELEWIDTLEVDLGVSFAERKCYDSQYIDSVFAYKVPDSSRSDTVIYVAYVSMYASFDLGAACSDFKNSDYGLIVIDHPRRHIGTLAHELGHMLGLNDIDNALPEKGHVWTTPPTSWIYGFGHDNVMWPGENFDAPGNRERFSLGQVFRFNFDENSWLFHSHEQTAPSLCCPCEPATAKPCPKLWTDIAKIPASGIASGWCASTRCSGGGT